MTVGNINYEKWQPVAYQSTANSTTQKNNTNVTIPETQQDVFLAQSTEKCTDGKDDGKIGFFSKVGNVVKGVFKQAGNMVKSAIQHPFKTAAMIGACFIPVVGPVIAGGLCVYGVYQGGKQILNGIAKAQNATTDAEAKLAWQDIGGGGFTAGLSVAGLKGSIKTLKNQVGFGEMGAEGACQTVKAIKNGESAGQVVRTAASETVENAANAAKAVGEKVKNGGEKLNKISESVKENGVVETTKNLIKDSKTYQKVSDIKDSLPSKAKSQSIIDQAKMEGAKIEYYDKAQTLPKKVTYSDGTIMEYSRAGNPTKTVQVDGVKTTTTKGNTSVETLDEGYYKIEGTSNSKTGINKTRGIRLDGDQVVQGIEGKYNTNSGSGYIKDYTKSGVNTYYKYNGKFYSASDLSLLQKAIIRFDSSTLGTIIAKANANAAYLAPFLNPEEN